MKRQLRDALQQVRHGLDEAIALVEHAPAAMIDDTDEDLAEVRARLAALEVRVSVIEGQREDT